MSNIGKARDALTKRILEGAGHASLSERMAAFHNGAATEAVRSLVDKVARHAHQVTDDDIATAKASGLSEDAIFEIVVCAAVGQANRQYESALAALDAAIDVAPGME